MKNKLVDLLKRFEKVELTGKEIYINSIKHSLKLIEKRKGGYENLIGSDKTYVDSTAKLAESYISGLEEIDAINEERKEKIEEFEKIIDESNTVIAEAKEVNDETQEALNELEKQTEEINNIVNEEKKEEKKSFFGKALDVVKNVITAPFRFAKKAFNFIFRRNKEVVTA